jgi:hypothetical protein
LSVLLLPHCHPGSDPQLPPLDLSIPPLPITDPICADRGHLERTKDYFFFQKLWEVATPKSPSEVAECNESGFRKIWVELKQGLKHSNISLWNQLGDICFNPCFNSTQILRKPDSLHSATSEGSKMYPTRCCSTWMSSMRLASRHLTCR